MDNLAKKSDENVYPFKNAVHPEEDFVKDGKITPLGAEYLMQFKRFSLFDNMSTAILFFIFLPIEIPMAILRFILLFAAFGTGLLLKKYLSFSLDDYPSVMRMIYFICLGVYIKPKDKEGVSVPKGDGTKGMDRCMVITSNHGARFDAMLLSNLHQADSTYLAAARSSFFGKLLIDSGFCYRSMTEGIALDTKEGREEWRRRLKTAYPRPMLFFPEGRVVHAPNTIMTFQSHLLQGHKMNIVCKKSVYKSYFVDHTQIELPFFRPPYSWLKHKTFWDSIIESLPFLVSFVTIFHTEVMGVVRLEGTETVEEINKALYALFFENGYTLVDMDQNLVKKLMKSLYL
ncbi:MAG: hypothetical protein HQK54_15265 [Oligoflexales bacterium]|nr:hypothetical protein [Oligoflexales bacterium]